MKSILPSSFLSGGQGSNARGSVYEQFLDGETFGSWDFVVSNPTGAKVKIVSSPSLAAAATSKPIVKKTRRVLPVGTLLTAVSRMEMSGANGCGDLIRVGTQEWVEEADCVQVYVEQCEDANAGAQNGMIGMTTNPRSNSRRGSGASTTSDGAKKLARFEKAPLPVPANSCTPLLGKMNSPPAMKMNANYWLYKVVFPTGVCRRSRLTFEKELASPGVSAIVNTGEVVTVSQRVKVGNVTFLKCAELEGWVFDRRECGAEVCRELNWMDYEREIQMQTSSGGCGVLTETGSTTTESCASTIARSTAGPGGYLTRGSNHWDTEMVEIPLH
eukprot:g1028.t1